MTVNELINAAEAGNIGRYLSGCICDQCGTSRYDIDIFTASEVAADAQCCDLTETFDTKEGYAHMTTDPRPNLASPDRPGAPLTEPEEQCGCCRALLPLNRTVWHTCAECKAECCDDCSMEIKGKWYCATCADSVIEELQERDREEEMYELYGESV